jgi:ABC-2 type transport system permease protein
MRSTTTTRGLSVMNTAAISPIGTPGTHGPALATRSTRADVGALPAALRSEWIKLSSLRSTPIITVATALLGVLTALAVARFVTDEVLFVSDVFVYSTVLTAALAAITGVLLFSSEVQHGTLAGTLAAQPARWVTVASKAIMAAGRGMALGAVGMAAGFAGALAGGLSVGDTPIVATAGWAMAFTGLAALLGLGLGMIVGHSSAAISGLLVWWFVVENLLAVFLPADALRFLPFYAGTSLLGIVSDFASPEELAIALSRPENALVFGGYALAALLAGTLLLYRRDAD